MVTSRDSLRERGASKSPNGILFLAANPVSTCRLAFDEECAAIERELSMADGRDDFDFRSKWAVTVHELMRHLNELRPTIIHFSGHGYGGTGTRSNPTSRDIDCNDYRSENGLYLQDEHGYPHCVTAQALRRMIGSAAASARVVVLNACYSARQASALCTVVDCVVGMRGAIRDDAARSFAVGFYRALGNHRSVGNAIEQATAILEDTLCRPCCRTRKGLRADQIVLSEESWSRSDSGRARMSED